MDLEPECRLGAAAAEEDPLDAEAVGRGVFEDVPRAAGRRLVDRAEDVAGPVGQRQSGDRPARLRVLVGRAVSLPVVADDQPLGARRHGRGLFVEHLEDVDAPLLGLSLAGCRRNGGDTSRGSSRWPSGRPRGCRAPRRSRRDSSRRPPSRRRPRATGRGGRCWSRRSRPRRRPASPRGRASPDRRRSLLERREFPRQGPSRGPPRSLKRASPLPSGTIRAGHF